MIFYLKVNDKKLNGSEKYTDQIKRVTQFLAKRYSLQDKNVIHRLGTIDDDFFYTRNILMIKFQ